jgi:hypothetical protein
LTIEEEVAQLKEDVSVLTHLVKELSEGLFDTILKYREEVVSFEKDVQSNRQIEHLRYNQIKNILKK